MNVINENVVVEEREEGEIIEDELEDVSDCSLNSPSCLGKSVATSNRLRAVSLSSISDSDLDVRLAYNDRTYVPFFDGSRRRKSAKIKSRSRKWKSNRLRHKKHTKLNSDTEDEEQLDRRTLRQLKEAVHINTSKEIQQNSLRSRLKCLIEPISGKSQSEEEGELNRLRAVALESQERDTNVENVESLPAREPTKVNESLNDKELTELRLEALKSAMITKHMARRKRRLNENQTEKPGNDVNKENSLLTANLESVENEERNDKKMNVESNNSTMEEDLDIMRAMLLASMSRKVATNPEPVPKVQEQIVPTKPPIKTNCVNNFRLQRALLPKRTIRNNFFNNKHLINVKPAPKLPSVAPLIINLKDSDSDMDLENPEEEVEDRITKTVTEFLKEQRAKIEAEARERTKPQNPKIKFDKSVVKLLPLSQQLEYQKLKQRLMNAKKNPRAQNFKPAASTSKSKQAAAKFTICGKETRLKINQEKKNTEDAFQQITKDLQLQRDGRLQSGKYQVLVPLWEKAKQIRLERDRNQLEFKHLLKDLEKAKSKLNTSHQQFKCIVEDLLEKKKEIEEGVEDGTREALITSTPCKTQKETNTTLEKLNESSIKVNEESEKQIVGQILDPNDVANVFVQRKAVEQLKKMPRYVSPLDCRKGPALAEDPMAMYCPYELLGVCKDKECTYKHCP